MPASAFCSAPHRLSDSNTAECMFRALPRTAVSDVRRSQRAKPKSGPCFLPDVPKCILSLSYFLLGCLKLNCLLSGLTGLILKSKGQERMFRTHGVTCPWMQLYWLLPWYIFFFSSLITNVCNRLYSSNYDWALLSDACQMLYCVFSCLAHVLVWVNDQCVYIYI